MDILEILTGILVLITGYYAYVTHRILGANKRAVIQMEKQIEDATRPYVLAHPMIREGSGIYELEITNLGRSTAYGFTIAIDKTFFAFGESNPDSDLEKLPIFQRGMPSMAPGFRISFYLANPIEILDDKKYQESVSPREFTITVKYKNLAGKEYGDDFYVDLRAFDHSVVRHGDEVDHLKSIAEELSKIERKLKYS